MGVLGRVGWGRMVEDLGDKCTGQYTVLKTACSGLRGPAHSQMSEQTSYIELGRSTECNSRFNLDFANSDEGFPARETPD